jgi:hypothetical protein
MNTDVKEAAELANGINPSSRLPCHMRFSKQLDVCQFGIKVSLIS